MRLDDVRPNAPHVNAIIAEFVGHRQPVVLQKPPLNVAGEGHHGEHVAPVPYGIFPTLQNSPLGVRRIPVIVKPSPAILVQHGPYFFLIVSREIQSIVEIGPGNSLLFNDVGIGYVRYAWDPIDIERVNPTPRKLGCLNSCRLAAAGWPSHSRDNFYLGTANTRKRKNRQRGHE